MRAPYRGKWHSVRSGEPPIVLRTFERVLAWPLGWPGPFLLARLLVWWLVPMSDEVSGWLRLWARARARRAVPPPRQAAVKCPLVASAACVARARKEFRSLRVPPTLPRLRALRFGPGRPSSRQPIARWRFPYFVPFRLAAAGAVGSARPCPQRRCPPWGPMLLRSFRNPFSWERRAPGRRGLTLVRWPSLRLRLGLWSSPPGSHHGVEDRTSVRLRSGAPRARGRVLGRRHLRSG